MQETILTEKIRDALRISSESKKITEDIEDCIAACKLDLEISGIVNIKEDDPIIIRAVKLFCKSDFNHNGLGEQYRQSYDLQKNSISLAGDYCNKSHEFDEK